MIDNKYTGPILKKDHPNFLFDRKLQQLTAILADENYWPDEGKNPRAMSEKSRGYKTFVADMEKAILKGRDITPKMFNAIRGIIKRYIKSSDPKHVEERDKRAELINDKLDKVIGVLREAKYEYATEESGVSFLTSISQQVNKTGRLSVKQKDALNKMYTKAIKRIKRNG